jgi:L-amino acid N-acyltransferase YncA
MPRLSDRMLAFLSDVDGERHIAVAARVRGKCVGIARAIVSRDRSSVADVAVAVADTHQRQGVGRSLVDALVTDARARGIGEFEATIHPANDAARGLARAVAATMSYRDGEWSPS